MWLFSLSWIMLLLVLRKERVYDLLVVKILTFCSVFSDNTPVESGRYTSLLPGGVWSPGFAYGLHLHCKIQMSWPFSGNEPSLSGSCVSQEHLLAAWRGWKSRLPTQPLLVWTEWSHSLFYSVRLENSSYFLCCVWQDYPFSSSLAGESRLSWEFFCPASGLLASSAPSLIYLRQNENQGISLLCRSLHFKVSS